MRWPWQSKPTSDRLVLSWCGNEAAYVLASVQSGAVVVRKAGWMGHVGADVASLAPQLLQLGFRGLDTTLILCVSQYQLLQIDTPNVPPEELRSAARYQVRDMLQAHVDDVTIDVLQVGDGHQQGANHSFVVAASNSVVAQMTALASAIDGQVSVIDIQETAQRNVQSALARLDGVLDRANAALVLVEGQQALLTISANEELFYARRFDVPEGFLTATWGTPTEISQPLPTGVDGYTPVQEYVPQHGGDLSLDGDLLKSELSPVAAPVQSNEDDRAQRLVLEIQRSLDVWDRTWSHLPLNRFRVFAGARSAELANWLTRQLGQPVAALDITPAFSGLESIDAETLGRCLPLLGGLLRTEVIA